MVQHHSQRSNVNIRGFKGGILSPGRQVLTAVICILFFILCILPSRAQDSKIRDMKRFYQNTCFKCHGMDGSAVGEDGKKLKGQDFTDRKWQQETSDDKMIKTIMKGKFFGLAMPSFKDMLSREDARIIVSDIIRKSEKGKIIAP